MTVDYSKPVAAEELRFEYDEDEDTGRTFEEPPQIEEKGEYVLELVRISQARWEKKTYEGKPVIDKKTGEQKMVLTAWFNFKAICDVYGDEAQAGREASKKVDVKAFFGDSHLKAITLALANKEPKELAKSNVPFSSLIGLRLKGEVNVTANADGDFKAWANSFKNLYDVKQLKKYLSKDQAKYFEKAAPGEIPF